MISWCYWLRVMSIFGDGGTTVEITYPEYF